MRFDFDIRFRYSISNLEEWLPLLFQGFFFFFLQKKRAVARMRVGRKFHFSGHIMALMQPRSYYESTLERIWVVEGKLWFLAADGSQKSIDNEPRGPDESTDRASTDSIVNTSHDEDDNDNEVEEEGVGGRMPRQLGVVAEGTAQCCFLVRDLQGIVPLAHAGQHISVKLVRAGLYERTPNGRVREQSVAAADAEHLASADFRAHLYDVTFCIRITIDREIQLRFLVSALAHNDPLILVDESQQRRDHARDNAALSLGADESSARTRGPAARARVPFGKRGGLAGQIDAAYSTSRTKMATMGGLISALPQPVRSSALVAFAPFYQAHSGALVAPRPNVAALMLAARVTGHQIRCMSRIELELLARYNGIEDTAELSIAERLFFGAFVDRIPLHEYEHALGQWRGIFYNERSFESGDKALKKWSRRVAEVLELPGASPVVAGRDPGFVAWALYDASYTLLARSEASTVFLLSDVVEQCRRRHRGDERFAPEAQRIEQGYALLCKLGVWQRAPADHVDEASGDAALQRAFVLARTLDVSTKLAERAFQSGVRFCDTGIYNDAVVLPLVHRRTLILYCGAMPTRLGASTLCMAVPRLLNRARHDPGVGSEMCVLVMTCDTVLLLGAHLLTEVQLLRLLDLIKYAPGPIALGDSTLYSPFAALTNAARLCESAARLVPIPEVPASHNALQQAVYRALCASAADVEAFAIVEREVRAVERSWVLAPGDMNRSRRWILVAHTPAAATAALQWLARSVPAGSADDNNDVRPQLLREELLRLAQNPARLESTVLLALPFVSYRGRCVRVARILALIDPPVEVDAPIAEYECTVLEHGSLTQSVSLDSDWVLLELDAAFLDVKCPEDHRICCDTWAANVMNPSMHRPHISAQSLPLARNAQPCDNRLLGERGATALVLTKDYTADALYAAAVRSTYHPRELAVVTTADVLSPVAALARRQPPPRTCVGDLYASQLLKACAQAHRFVASAPPTTTTADRPTDMATD
jgi:hypothetical protein